MTLSIQHVDTAFIPAVWPQVERYLDAGLNKDDDSPEWSRCYNLHHVQGFLTSGAWLLVVAVDDAGNIHGAGTVSFVTYPLQRVAFITLIGGKLIANPETFEQFKQLLRQRGATKIQGYGRESIVRLWRKLGFEPRTTLVEAPI